MHTFAIVYLIMQLFEFNFISVKKHTNLTSYYMYEISLRAQTALRGVVALHYCGSVDNDMPQLHTMLSEPLD